MRVTRYYLVLILLLAAKVQAGIQFRDPSEGRAFLPWAWEEHLSPTIHQAFDDKGLLIIGAGISASTFASNYDDKVRDYKNEHGLGMDRRSAKQFSFLASGAAGLIIFGTQMLEDQENGLKFARAHLLANASHYALAVLIGKERPAEDPSSIFKTAFPSGHTTTAFVTAGSLAYAYGPAAGVPAYTLATLVALSRIQLERHWVSDVVGGAFLGTFWARASFKQEENKTAEWMALPVNDGMMLVLRANWN